MESAIEEMKGAFENFMKSVESLRDVLASHAEEIEKSETVPSAPEPMAPPAEPVAPPTESSSPPEPVA